MFELPSKANWGEIAKDMFRRTQYSYQARILETVFKKKHRRVSIRAMTRAGKSISMDEVAIIAATLIDKCPVGVIAPTHPKKKIIMNYIADDLAANPLFNDIVMLETAGMSQLERLRKEVNKNRITFKNGSSISALSIDLASRGMAVMGFAFKVIIIDETSEIDDESYAKIYRMLIESPDAILIEIGNPWNLGHFYRHHHDEDWESIHIPWQECVKAGRITLEEVEDQRKNLTALEFRVLFDAEFPDEVEYAVFSAQAIREMIKREELLRYEKIIMGVDVARGGRDISVITIFGVSGNKAYYIEHKTLDARDVMQVSGLTAMMVEGYKALKYKVEIAVDTVGNGAGVKDRLKEIGYDVHEFIAGESARNNLRFYNSKTEVAFRVAEIMEKGLVRNIPEKSKYYIELRSWLFEVRSDKQLKIVDPEDKSPDFGDSLLIALSRFIYHDELIIHAPEQQNLPSWRGRKPTNFLHFQR